MCGIAGIINLEPNEPVNEHALRDMCSAMVHRGPDDEGVYVERDIGLCMRRLAIIDPETGQQPISNEDDSVRVVQNGEIYNFRELRDELQRRGHTFRSKTDTECIVHLYEEYGVRCVDRLRGMFSLAVWDSRQRRLLLARDRLGIKPLYYGIFSGRLCFASELKALLQLACIPRELNWKSLGYYLSYGYTPRDESIIAGIKKLEPGHLLAVRPGAAPYVEQYWDVAFAPNARLTLEDAAAQLRILIDEAVANHMISDVPLGAFLSGGVDSSAVVAAMCQVSPRPIKTFSIRFAEEEYDESKYARQVAEHCGTEHHELLVGADSWKYLEDIVWHADEPFGDSSSIPTYLVSKLAAQHVTVALSGDGGDELFGGYDKYFVEARERRRERLPAFVREAMAGIGRSLPEGTTGRNFLIHLGLTGEQRYFDASTMFKLEQQQELLQPDVYALVAAEHWRRERHWMHRLPWLAGIQRLDIKTYLPLDILTKVDRMSMAHSLEVRPPLLDHHIVEFAATLPQELQWAKGRSKSVLKESVQRRLPSSILQRSKRGFAVPIASWFRSSLQSMVQDVLFSRASMRRGHLRSEYVQRIVEMHRRGRDADGKIWALLALELWCRQNLDGSRGATSLRETVPDIRLNRRRLG